jgi:hypothetical protein
VCTSLLLKPQPLTSFLTLPPLPPSIHSGNRVIGTYYSDFRCIGSVSYVNLNITTPTCSSATGDIISMTIPKVNSNIPTSMPSTPAQSESPSVDPTTTPSPSSSPSSSLNPMQYPPNYFAPPMLCLLRHIHQRIIQPNLLMYHLTHHPSVQQI